MNLFKSTLIFSLLISIKALGSGSYIRNDYDSNFYQEEGNVLVKLSGVGLLATGQQTDLPISQAKTPKEIPGFVHNGFGADTSATVFFHEKFASQLSLGFNIYKTRLESIQGIISNYATNPNASIKEAKDIYAIPLSFTLQYYPAPFGGIMPYIGAGYSYTYFFSRAEEYEVAPALGPVLQLGCDFMMKDDAVIFAEVKYFMVKPKVRYKESFLGNSLSNTIDLSPFVISLGFGLKF